MACGRQEKSKNCLHGLHHSSEHLSLSCESPVVEGVLVLESGVWNMDPGRGQLLAVKRQPKGTGVRSSTNGKVYRKSLGYHRSKLSLLMAHKGQGHQYNPFSLLPASLAFTVTGRDSQQRECAPDCSNCLSVPAAAGNSPHPSCGCHTLPWPEGISVPQSATAFAPSYLGQKQTPEGSAHAEVGPKPKLSPSGSETKEEEWKSFLQLHKPWITSP